MSGPKVSIYTVAPYIRENILKQRSLQRQCMGLEHQLLGFLEKLSAQKAAFQEVLEEAERLRSGEPFPFAEASAELLCQCDEVYAQAVSMLRACGPVGGMPKKYTYSVEKVEQSERLLRQLQAIDAMLKESGCLHSMDENAAEINTFLKEARIKKENALLGSVDPLVSFAAISRRKKTIDWSFRDQALQQLVSIQSDAEYSEALMKRAAALIEPLNAISDPIMARNIIAVSVQPVLQMAEMEKRKRKQEYEEYRSLWEAYHAICERLDWTPVAVPFSEGWREALEARMEEAERCLLESQEKEFIASAVDQVMREMGYDVLGKREIRKRSGITYHSSLYSYGEGKAIHVTRSSDGQITMELGGLDHADRLPDEAEASMLAEQMAAFCNDFSRFEERLKKKGVVLDERIQMMPPDEAFATIINMDDYDIPAGVEAASIHVEIPDVYPSGKEYEQQ